MDTLNVRLSAIIAALAVGTMTSTNVMADSPSYDYFEVGYVNADVDNPDIDGDGFGLAGSLSINENWFIAAGYTDIGLDFGFDLSLIDIGVGYRHPMSDTTDIAVTGKYVKADLSGGGFGSSDDDGYGLGVMVRSMVSDQFELNGGINYVDFGGNDGDDTSFEVGGVYSFTNNIAVGAGVEIGDDITSYQIGFRYYFNR